MASKFQGRLIGTILVVAIGVIVLPDVLDGKKEHYEDDFAAIPLNPNQSDESLDVKSPEAMKALEGISESSENGEHSPQNTELAANQDSEKTDKSQVEVAKRQDSEDKPPQKVIEQTAQTKIKKEESPTVAPKVETAQKAENKKTTSEIPAQYKDSAWIIQLVALRNQENAQKLAEDLKNRGYQVNVKVQGGVSRVIVGPDISRDKVLKQIQELEKITGLKGQLQKFKPLN